MGLPASLVFLTYHSGRVPNVFEGVFRSQTDPPALARAASAMCKKRLNMGKFHPPTARATP